MATQTFLPNGYNAYRSKIKSRMKKSTSSLKIMDMFMALLKLIVNTVS